MDCKSPYNVKVSHFIPTEVRLALFKASVTGRNDAESMIKNFKMKKNLCIKSKSDYKSKKQNNIDVSSSLNTKYTNKSLVNDCLTKTCFTPKVKMKINERIEKSAGSEYLEADISNDNEQFVQTSDRNNYPCNNLDLSGIKKLADSPNKLAEKCSRSFNDKNNVLSPLQTEIPNRHRPNLQVSTTTLNGATIFVDVRSESENRSQGVKGELSLLGAKVENNFTKKVTIVVFKDGLMSTYKRAKQWNIPMVSVLWVEACKNELAIVPSELYPPLNVDRYETALIVDSVSKKKTNKKKVEVAVASTSADSNNKNEGTKIPETKNSELLETPVHEDGFIQALLTLAGDELKDFLNRPLARHHGDDDSDVAIPLSVRLLHKHVVERRALTSVKEYLGNLEENVKTLSDRGRLKLRKLVFPSSNEERPEKKLTDDFKYPDNMANIKNIALIKHGLENIRKSAPAGFYVAKSRQSAPAKVINNIQVNKQNGTNTFNILKYFDKITHKPVMTTDQGHKSQTESNDMNCEASIQSVDKDVLINITNTKLKRKRKKLFTSHLNVDASELSDTLCEPLPYVCPYVESPQKKKKLMSNLNSECSLNTVSKSQRDENDVLVVSNSQNCLLDRRGSSVLFVETKGKKVDLHRLPPTIVCTSIIRKDMKNIIAMVNKLGKFSIEKTVNEKTTHVITSVPRRTINLLKGIARGIWILKDEWIYKSFDSGKWLNEEPFELVEFSPSVKQSRLERLAFGPEFCLELFNKVGYIYVCKQTKPSYTDLMELLRLCGGKLVNSPVVANIIVGSDVDSHCDAILVKENWILDSVSSNKCLNPQLYRFNSS